MTKYTDEQINEAIMLANQTGKVYVWEIEMYRNVIEHLPEPQDDWQQCRFEDIRKGDRVKVVDTHEAGDQTVHEGDVVQVSKGLVMTANHQLQSVCNSKWYRIPAPVTPPDPAQHQFIRVDGKDYEAIPESGRYKLLGPGLATVHVINRENITEWTELELVPKEVAEDDR